MLCHLGSYERASRRPGIEVDSVIYVYECLGCRASPGQLRAGQQAPGHRERRCHLRRQRLRQRCIQAWHGCHNGHSHALCIATSAALLCMPGSTHDVQKGAPPTILLQGARCLVCSLCAAISCATLFISKGDRLSVRTLQAGSSSGGPPRQRRPPVPAVQGRIPVRRPPRSGLLHQPPKVRRRLRRRVWGLLTGPYTPLLQLEMLRSILRLALWNYTSATTAVA